MNSLRLHNWKGAEVSKSLVYAIHFTFSVVAKFFVCVIVWTFAYAWLPLTKESNRAHNKMYKSMNGKRYFKKISNGRIYIMCTNTHTHTQLFHMPLPRHLMNFPRSFAQYIVLTSLVYDISPRFTVGNGSQR